MVDRRDQRNRTLQGQQAVAEALVVVHHVELVGPGPQQLRRAQAEGQRLREPGGPHGADLQQVDGITQLPPVRRAEGIRLVVEIEAVHCGQVHAGIQFRVRLTGEHLDVVPQFGKPAAEVPDVDALPAAVRLTPVGQQRDPHYSPHTARGRRAG